VGLGVGVRRRGDQGADSGSHGSVGVQGGRCDQAAVPDHDDLPASCRTWSRCCCDHLRAGGQRPGPLAPGSAAEERRQPVAQSGGLLVPTCARARGHAGEGATHHERGILRHGDAGLLDHKRVLLAGLRTRAGSAASAEFGEDAGVGVLADRDAIGALAQGNRIDQARRRRLSAFASWERPDRRVGSTW